MTKFTITELHAPPKPRRCANCHQPCRSIFCCLECAEERYSIIHEALEAMSTSVRYHLGLTR